MKYKNIVILANTGIGDFVRATSALSLIRQYDKNIEITLITCNRYVDLIDKSLNINKIITANNKYYSNYNRFIRTFYKLFWSIKNLKYFYKKDAFLFLDISMFFAIIVKYLYRKKNIIGPDNFSFGYNIPNSSSKFYTIAVKMPKDADRDSVIMRYQMITRFVFPTYNLCLPVLPNTKHLKDKILNLMGKTNKYKIVISPCGSVPWRRFDTQFLKDLILKLNNLYDITFFIAGNSKADKECCLKLLNLIKQENVDIRNIVGETSLLELKELFYNTDLLITVDTGTYHIAATTSVPIISVHSGVFPENSGAISSKVIPLCSYRECAPCGLKLFKTKFVCKNPLCVKDITSEMVIDKVTDILSSKIKES